MILLLSHLTTRIFPEGTILISVFISKIAVFIFVLLDEIKMSVQLQSDKSVLSFPFIAFSPDKSFESVDHAMGNRVNEAGLVINVDKTGFDPSQTVSLMKSFQTKYTVSIWDETFKAIRYYQDKISLRCLHREFCHTWQSKLVDGVECNFTYFINMPVINIKGL